jgi:2-polyprenyl-3-methyl-5-hydroxy-6-metoxy-1,4-benzoquinol methylase
LKTSSALLRDILARPDFPAEDRAYVVASRQRLEFTIEWLRCRGLSGVRVVEIGLGPIGICCSLLGAVVDAWDVRTLWRPLGAVHNVRFSHADLSDPTWEPPVRAAYDYVLFPEVIEHVPVAPSCLLRNIARAMKPGGVMLLTTPNLLRLSNRIRMLAGRRLFSEFTPEALQIGHVREYTLDEVRTFFQRAGYYIAEARLVNWDLGDYASLIKPLLRFFPRLANFIWIVAAAPTQ